jgi:hypothetical protein
MSTLKDPTTLKERISGSMQQVGVGGVAALAAGAVLIAGITAVGAANGADDRPSAAPVTVSMPGDDDGTPDQGSGDAPGTPGGPSTTVGTTPTTAPATAPTTSPSTTVAAPTTLRTVPVPGVGEVVVDDATLALVSATPAPGFTVRSESSARELHVRFFAPDGGRIDVQVEHEDGGVRVRVRDRRLEGDGSGRGRGGESPSSTSVPAASPAPPTTVDDHGGDRDRDDRVEPGDDRSSDDDRSGSGSGRDDDHDDDRSGRGGGED